jgi:hypothetical protein
VTDWIDEAGLTVGAGLDAAAAIFGERRKKGK